MKIDPRKDAWPLRPLEFRSREPTRVGGRRVPGPTGPARDSSLKIDKAPRIVLLTYRAATRGGDIGCLAWTGKCHRPPQFSARGLFADRGARRWVGDGAAQLADGFGAEARHFQLARLDALPRRLFRRFRARCVEAPVAAEIEGLRGEGEAATALPPRSPCSAGAGPPGSPGTRGSRAHARRRRFPRLPNRRRAR